MTGMKLLFLLVTGCVATDPVQNLRRMLSQMQTDAQADLAAVENDIAENNAAIDRTNRRSAVTTENSNENLEKYAAAGAAGEAAREAASSKQQSYIKTGDKLRKKMADARKANAERAERARRNLDELNNTNMAVDRAMEKLDFGEGGTDEIKSMLEDLRKKFQDERREAQKDHADASQAHSQMEATRNVELKTATDQAEEEAQAKDAAAKAAGKARNNEATAKADMEYKLQQFANDVTDFENDNKRLEAQKRSLDQKAEALKQGLSELDGQSFLQLSSSPATAAALQYFKTEAKALKSPQLAAIALSISTGGPFDSVISMIKKAVDTLNDQKEKDAAYHGECVVELGELKAAADQKKTELGRATETVNDLASQISANKKTTRVAKRDYDYRHKEQTGQRDHIHMLLQRGKKDLATIQANVDTLQDSLNRDAVQENAVIKQVVNQVLTAAVENRDSKREDVADLTKEKADKVAEIQRETGEFESNDNKLKADKAGLEADKGNADSARDTSKSAEGTASKSHNDKQAACDDMGSSHEKRQNQRKAQMQALERGLTILKEI